MTSTAREPGVQANPDEARHLVQRGVAAAQGGQRRVAAGLLTQALRLDPRDERAWLWLSGVLDDPAQRAFCLEAVLKINPQSTHAHRGLAQLARAGQAAAAQPVPGLAAPAESAGAQPAQPAPPAPARRDAGDAWWVSWRRNRHEMSRARLLVWGFPLVVVVAALLIHQSFSAARARGSVADPAYSVAAAPPAERLAPTAAPLLEAEPLAVVEGLTVAYLAAVEPIRADLRAATEAYRATTSQPGGASVGHVAATQRLRATVAQALADLGELRAPGVLQPAHDDYRAGLELELAGLDAVLEFYGSYDVANANRAALRFQEARAFIERAQAGYQAQSQILSQIGLVSPHTAR